MTTVNENNTKAQILTAYKEVLEQLKLAQAGKLDPAAEVATKKNAQTLEKADSTAEVGIADKIAALQKNITNVLGGLAGQLSEEIDTFNNLQHAISLKEAELKELFGIEKEAFALAALINTQKELKDKFHEEQNVRLIEVNAKFAEVNNQISQARLDYQKEINELRAQDKKDRQREQEEYKYNFERQKVQERNELQDELDAKRKEFNEEVEALNERAAEISKREEKLDELEAKVAEFPVILAQTRKEAEEAGRKDEQKTSAIKESYAKRDFENKTEVFNNKIESLEQALADEKARAAELAAKLDDAYNKIQNMALKSVESSNESKLFNQIQNLNNNNQK